MPKSSNKASNKGKKFPFPTRQVLADPRLKGLHFNPSVGKHGQCRFSMTKRMRNHLEQNNVKLDRVSWPGTPAGRKDAEEMAMMVNEYFAENLPEHYHFQDRRLELPPQHGSGRSRSLSDSAAIDYMEKQQAILAQFSTNDNDAKESKQHSGSTHRRARSLSPPPMIGHMPPRGFSPVSLLPAVGDEQWYNFTAEDFKSSTTEEKKY